MADVNANIGVSIDTSDALNQLKNLQRQISQFHQSVAKSSSAAAIAQRDLQKNFVNGVNAIQGFSAELRTVRTSAESFTNSLEKNKFSIQQYFRYAASQTKTFGKNFTAEFSTIEKTAIERVKTLQTQYIKMGRDANGAMQAIAIRPTVLNMKDLGTQTAIAAQKQVLFNQLIKQGSTNLLNFGKNTQWAGRQLMVGFTLPLATLGMTAGRVFMDMEKAAIKFKKVYGDLFTAPAETEKALDSIVELGLAYTKYGVAVSDSLSVAADAAAAGFQGVDLQNQTTASLKLSVLGQMELQKALETTIALQNAFRISSEELSGTIDFLNAVENQTVVSLDDITEATPRVATVIQSLGGDVKDLAFFLAAMKEGGVNAAQGANALKSGLASLINPTERASELLAGMGINIRSIVSQNQGDLRATVIGFARALDTLDPMRRAQAIEQLFGKFQFARISALFDNVIRDGSQASRVLDLAGSSLEDLASLSEKELGVSAASAMNKFRASIEQVKVALAPLGELFLEIATPFIDFATNVLTAFNNLPDGIKRILGTVITVIGGLGPVLLMTFGLINNGIANMIKFFATVRLGYLKMTGQAKGIGDETQYMTQEQLEAAAAAASLDQAHAGLTQRFTAEKTAVDALRAAYEQAAAAGARFATLNPGMMKPGTQATKYAKGGVVTVGGRGNKDTEPALLTPGEAVIPAAMVKKYQPLIEGMIAGNIPGYAKGVMLGMPKSAKSVSKSREASEEIYQMFLKSSYANTAPTEYGHQISPTSGHSFPIFGLGGVYQKGNKQVFVKPVLDEKAALAEMRSTEITRKAHGLQAPEQRIVVIRDPMDTTRQRRFLALESDLDPKFVNNQPMGLFNEDQYFKQLVASLLRVDKDLSGSNVFGNVVADAGPAGVFNRASGLRDYEKNLPSMEDQALVNLLGIKGGAKRAFAESTLSLMSGLTPEQYKQRMLGEIQKVLPRLKETIASFRLTNPTEVGVYDDMVRRLEAGLGVDWAKFHSVHSAVKIPKPKVPKQSPSAPGYKDGVVSVPGPKGAGDVVAAMLAPGEAVIPAAMAKKYAPLIQGMIAGNIPGYQIGTAAVGGRGSVAFGGKSYETRGGSEEEIARIVNELIKFGSKAEDVTRMLDGLEKGGKLTIKSLQESAKVNDKIVSENPNKQQRLVQAHLQTVKQSDVNPVTGERTMGSFTRRMLETQNSQLKKGQDSETFSKQYKSVIGGLNEAVSLGGVELTDSVKKTAQLIDDQIHDAALKIADGGKVTDQILEQAANQVLDTAEKAGGEMAQVARALKKVRDDLNFKVVAPATVETRRAAGIQGQNETELAMVKRLMSEGKLYQEGRNVKTTELGRSLSSTAEFSRFDSKGGFATKQRVNAIPGSKTYLDGLGSDPSKLAKIGVSVSNDIRDEVGESLLKASASASPSEKTIQASNNMVDGVTETLVNSKDDVAKATETMVSPVTQKRTGPRRASSDPAVMAALAGNQAVVQASRGPRRASAPQGPPTPPRPGEPGFIGPMMGMAQSVQKTKTGLDNMMDTTSKLSIGLSSITGILYMFGGEMQGIAGVISMVSAGLFGLISIVQAYRDLQITNMVLERAKAVTTAIQTAMTAASAAGLGIFATVTSVASAAMTALLGPLGLIILAIAAVTAVFVGIGFIIKGQIDKLEAFGKIVDVTADQIKFLGDAAGESPITQSAFGTASASPVEEVNTAAAKQKAEDEEFLRQFDVQIQATKDGAKASVEEALNMLAYRLSSTGLSDRVVEDTMAGIIRASKRTDIEFDFNSVGISEANTNALFATLNSQIQKISNVGGQANVGKGIISIMESFGLQLQAETINLQEYTLQMQKLQNEINSIADEGTRANVINQAVDSLISDENLRTQIKSVQDLDKRFLLLQASGGASGLVLDDLITKANDSATSNEDLAKAIKEVTAAQIENNKISNQQIDLEIITEEAVGGLREETAAINDKITAYNLLVAAGYSAADSLRLLNNQVLVGQIVQANSVASTVTDINNLLAAQAAMDAITARAGGGGGGGQKSPFQEAMDSLKEQAKEAKNSIMAYAKLRTAGLGVAEAAKIAGDSMLAAALASQQVGSRKWNELVTAIRAARAEEEAWLSSTPEGRAEQFAEVYGKVMDVFDSQEAILEMNNEAATATNRKLIESLEKQIDAYNRRINVLQRDLDSIGEKEDEINKTYDERSKALETVKKLNQDIINQQKSQLSIADALSRGDVSAAASAMQDARAQNAAAQGDAAGTALEAARQGQLNALTQNGKTRAQLEAEIKQIKKDISDIEFGALQNAQDAVDKANEQLDLANENLRVQGLSKIEWENINTRIDASRATASLYDAEVLKALENARGLVGEWSKLEDTFTTTHVINTVRTGSGGGGGVGAEDAAPASGENPAYTDLANKIKSMEAQYAAYQSQLTPLNEEKAGYERQRANWLNVSIWPKLDKQIKDVQAKINGILDAQRWTGRGISDSRSKLAAIPQYLADGGFAKGTDTVPAMLTPGEFVVNKMSANKFAPILEAINTGSFRYSMPSGPTIPNDFAQPVYNMPSRKYTDLNDSIGVYSTPTSPPSLTAQDNSVYNYSLSVNVEGTNASANDIANVVMNKIKTVESQNVRRQVLR
jgi:TP901 family phage tail tape measure protein